MGFSHWRPVCGISCIKPWAFLISGTYRGAWFFRWWLLQRSWFARLSCWKINTMLIKLFAYCLNHLLTHLYRHPQIDEMFAEVALILLVQIFLFTLSLGLSGLTGSVWTPTVVTDLVLRTNPDRLALWSIVEFEIVVEFITSEHSKETSKSLHLAYCSSFCNI